MEAGVTLRGNIHKLCNDHMTAERGVITTRPPLLLSLSEAVTGQSKSGASGGGSSGASIPVSPAAVDLERLINLDARYDHYAMRGWRYPGTVRSLLQSYLSSVMQPPDDEWEIYLEHVTLDWIDKIEALIYPSKPRRKIPFPCPACGQLWCNDDGESRDYCLTVNCWDGEDMMPPSHWDAACGGCGAEWRGEAEIKFFLAATGQKELA